MSLGKNTIDCMRSGIIYGNVDRIDGFWTRREKELESLPPSSLQADWPSSSLPLCRHKIVVDDALLLKGLLILYRKNTEVH